MEEAKKEKRWIAMLDTVCAGLIPSFWEDDMPVIHETEREAWKEIVEFHIVRLQGFLDAEPGDPQYDRPDLDPEDMAYPCEVDQAGNVYIKDPTVYHGERVISPHR